MTGRPYRSMRDIRGIVLRELRRDGWVGPSAICDRHGLDHGADWLRVCLILERMANNGEIVIKIRGKNRWFRRKAA